VGEVQGGSEGRSQTSVAAVRTRRSRPAISRSSMIWFRVGRRPQMGPSKRGVFSVEDSAPAVQSSTQVVETNGHRMNGADEGVRPSPIMWPRVKRKAFACFHRRSRGPSLRLDAGGARP